MAITGFGSFEPRARAARVGRNPQTGAELQIAASVAPGFSAGANVLLQTVWRCCVKAWDRQAG